MCKRTPFNFFTADDLTAMAATWKKGKAPALMGSSKKEIQGIITEGEHLLGKMAAMYSDALYKGYLPNTSDSVTTLLAKKLIPLSWEDTRPITLSCTNLKIMAQLLLGKPFQTSLIQQVRNGLRRGNKPGSYFCPEAYLAHGAGLGETSFRAKTRHQEGL